MYIFSSNIHIMLSEDYLYQRSNSIYNNFFNFKIQLRTSLPPSATWRPTLLLS